MNPTIADDDTILALIELGMEIPKDDLDREPELTEECYFYYTAFKDLCQYREPMHQRDFLPWDILNSYAIRYGLNNEEFEYFVEVIRVLEQEVLDIKAGKVQEKEETPNGETDN